MQQELADCTFTPNRKGARASDVFLKRMGRDRPVTADDFQKYKEEKERRNEVLICFVYISLPPRVFILLFWQARRQIMAEIEDKELTFKPTISGKSILIRVRFDRH